MSFTIPLATHSLLARKILELDELRPMLNQSGAVNLSDSPVVQAEVSSDSDVPAEPYDPTLLAPPTGSDLNPAAYPRTAADGSDVRMGVKPLKGYDARDPRCLSVGQVHRASQEDRDRLRKHNSVKGGIPFFVNNLLEEGVSVQTPDGRHHLLQRMMLDTGSDVAIMEEVVAKAIGLSYSPVDVSLRGVGGCADTVIGMSETTNVVISPTTEWEVSVPVKWLIVSNLHGLASIILGSEQLHPHSCSYIPAERAMRYLPFLQKHADFYTQRYIPMNAVRPISVYQHSADVSMMKLRCCAVSLRSPLTESVREPDTPAVKELGGDAAAVPECPIPISVVANRQFVSEGFSLRDCVPDFSSELSLNPSEPQPAASVVQRSVWCALLYVLLIHASHFM
jgi:hypothetical protein